MAAIDEPCAPWTDEALVFSLPGTRAVDQEMDPTATALAIRIASAWLYRLSGRRFSGECEITVRPISGCDPGAVLPGGSYVYGMPLWFDSRTGQYGYDSRRWDDPGGEGVSEISLGYAPIRAVSLVTIDGAAFTGYRIDDARTLVRTDGQRWPTHQDLTLPTTEPGTFAVRFTYGDDPPGRRVRGGGPRE